MKILRILLNHNLERRALTMFDQEFRFRSQRRPDQQLNYIVLERVGEHPMKIEDRKIT